MTHRELIDYCNSVHGNCDRGICDRYTIDMCEEFKRLHGTTPYLENRENGGMYYTDDILSFFNSCTAQPMDDIDDSVKMCDLLI